ncbi:SRPBCC domain-containing protein [Micromonospora sp. H61]|uniref:SRPBCC domain-containing protein n=1 Tax=Micromonospora sp. H61 TaxID=2824888 RepID=UPI001FFD6133|nr:SRPBCC domain-containing protein [Micromonospora sp. H61]
MDRDAFRPSPPADVRAEPTDVGATLVFVRDLRHPPATVWAALTDPAQLAQWAPFLADRDLGHAGVAVLTLVDGETTQEDPATVRRAEPPHLLEYTWGDDLLRWELSPLGSGTRLTLRHTVADRPGHSADGRGRLAPLSRRGRPVARRRPGRPDPRRGGQGPRLARAARRVRRTAR